MSVRELYEDAARSQLGNEILRLRTRNLLLILSAAHFQVVQRSRHILRFLDSGQDVPLKPLSPEPNAILRALCSIIWK
jgi:hypothetical protein